MIMAFMMSMLFTVFNFIPVIEEENPSSRIELCKKNNPDPSSADDSDSSDEDPSPDFFCTGPSAFSSTNENFNYAKRADMSCQDYERSCIKPPPRS